MLTTVRKSLDDGPNPEKIREIVNKITSNTNYNNVFIDFSHNRVLKHKKTGTIIASWGGAIALLAIEGLRFKKNKKGDKDYLYLFPSKEQKSIYMERIITNYVGKRYFWDFIYGKQMHEEIEIGVPLGGVYRWLIENHEVWGNHYATNMFDYHEPERAFGYNSANWEECTLPAITSYLLGFADRKEAWDKENGVTY